MNICTVEDEFVREVPRWVVVLSDGTTVYQDDDRPGAGPPSAWMRLGLHCSQHGLHIERMHLQFRSNVVRLPGGKAAYFFARAAFGCSASAETVDGFVAGWADGDLLTVGRWRVPELQLLGLEERRATPGPCLIARVV